MRGLTLADPGGKRDVCMDVQVHAEDEVEHAAIGHEAVMAFVPEAQRDVLERAMRDHDRDFAVFYNGIAEMLE